MEKDQETARRVAAVRGCARVLGGRGRPGVREAMARLAAVAAEFAGADDLPDVYGDGLVAEVERQVAAQLGTQDAAFFPTGTMAQQVALRSWAGRTGSDVVALHPLAHPEVHERGALGVVSGLRTVYPTREPRMANAEEIRAFEEPFGTLMVELPLRDAGFVLPTWDELVATVAAARERDAVVHFDGARLWECPSHFGKPLAEIAGLADSVYVSFYKSLEGVSGAALGASAEVIAEAKAWRHRYGGLLFQQYPTALSALAGLRDELPRLPSYVAHAEPVARALREGFAEAGLDWPRVHPERPHTHQFQLWLPYPAEALNEASVRQAEQDRVSLFGRGQFRAPGLPGLSMIEVTVAADALEWTEQDVRDAAGSFARHLAHHLATA
ncbi:L-threonine aldolase [Streptomyces sp. DvalAA-14]|uniref:threonine aldolase family protein n=1 Tax=unclassified Streptomyces TaxID=2593676 RepID=UPI00081B10AD|nr:MULTISPECIES: beta-eliminating lyase-related protein [unclassified Streptomyces]MYS20099.1 threonine aldolase [Streptomyces sp. SID4948]SCD60841.1 L-threonine aldolase [Streptomyces sp. DvalAA-14]